MGVEVLVGALAGGCAVTVVQAVLHWCRMEHARLLQEASDRALAALGAERVRLRLALARIGRLAEDCRAQAPPHDAALARAVLGNVAAEAQAALREGEGGGGCG